MYTEVILCRLVRTLSTEVTALKATMVIPNLTGDYRQVPIVSSVTTSTPTTTSTSGVDNISKESPVVELLSHAEIEAQFCAKEMNVPYTDKFSEFAIDYISGRGK